MSNKLRDKIYSMSNSFLPLDMFYNDIENMSKYPSFSMELAFRDLEKIADFILDLQSQFAITEKALELACETLQDINFKLYNTEMNFVDFFKQQAKEMLGNE